MYNNRYINKLNPTLWTTPPPPQNKKKFTDPKKPKTQIKAQH